MKKYISFITEILIFSIHKDCGCYILFISDWTQLKFLVFFPLWFQFLLLFFFFTNSTILQVTGTQFELTHITHKQEARSDTDYIPQMLQCSFRSKGVQWLSDFKSENCFESQSSFMCKLLWLHCKCDQCHGIQVQEFIQEINLKRVWLYHAKLDNSQI